MDIDGRIEAQKRAHTTGGACCVAPLDLALGEGALWLERDVFGSAAFWCVDILGRRVWRFDPATDTARSWAAPDMPGFVAPAADGTFVAGLPDGLYRFDPRDGAFAPILAVEADRPGNRLNDGHVDRDGRLWFGTMNLAESDASGALYATDGLLGADPTARCVDEGYVVTNGPAVSPDGSVLYHADSANQLIYAFDRFTDGTLMNRRIFARLAHGYPDGLAVDEQGHIWAGIWGGGRVLRLAPDGALSGAMAIPADNVTKLAFGGPERKTAYVTTARTGLRAAQLAQQPQAGGVFTFDLDVPGMAQHVLV